MNDSNENIPTPGTQAANRAALLAAVLAHPFLRGLAPAHANTLADNAMFVSWKSGEMIFREGDPANRFYLIQNGRVALESVRRDQPPRLIQHIGAGDVLGWSWLFPPYYWHFDAQATEPTTAIFFYGTRLREQCEQDHELGYELMKRMAAVVIQRLQMTRRQLLAAPQS
ncbi:MAG: Crp/Fnr family transcriptional regulator [Verrucomicrobia bacterium]|nr:Crp/Fnr family transcriptional regulator [Verrucomicrobiota bacterium]